ncbi:MAG: hypothetical protein FMNOHCHN_03828 [Ignavibacteriaceae bacterium]|nr:hypothetical protein [Ignavibacteriaceae bacterium]
MVYPINGAELRLVCSHDGVVKEGSFVIKDRIRFILGMYNKKRGLLIDIIKYLFARY